MLDMEQEETVSHSVKEISECQAWDLTEFSNISFEAETGITPKTDSWEKFLIVCQSKEGDVFEEVELFFTFFFF
jgi:hypothetical protein